MTDIKLILRLIHLLVINKLIFIRAVMDTLYMVVFV